MGWIGCVRCEKFQNDFMAQTCALITPVQPVFQRVLCNNETLPNAPQTLRDAPKYEFRVQCGGLRDFVVKNYDATSWHKLLH